MGKIFHGPTPAVAFCLQASLVYIAVLTRRKLAAAYEVTARERDQEQQLLATASDADAVDGSDRQTTSLQVS